MKTHRKSRSIESRNAVRKMTIRGRASASRDVLFQPDVVLSGRRFRRANGFTHADVAQLGSTMFDADDNRFPTSFTGLMNPYTRAILAYDLS